MGKLHLNLIRVFGLLLTAVSLYYWTKGGDIGTVEYHGVTVSLPLALILTVLGATFFLFPILPLTIFVALAPEALTGWARKVIQEYTLPSPADGTPVPADPLSERLNTFIKHSNRRFWSTIIAILFFVTLIAPFLVTVQIARSSFRQHSNGLIRRLTETRFDASSADAFRRELQEAGPSLESFDSTATHEIYTILSKLYGPAVTNTPSFERQLSALYDEKIRPHVLQSVGIIDIDTLSLPYQPSLEPIAAKITLLSLLANICNEQGNQGKYIDPYLQARQLLRIALTNKVRDQADLAYTHNVLGVNYADSLRCYSQYLAKLASRSDASQKIRLALGEDQPLSPFSLARSADTHYRLAADASSNSFAKARYLNNSADLRISLLQKAHIHGEPIEGRDNAADEQFIVQNVDPPIQNDPSWHPTRLELILKNLAEDLTTAIDLAHAPRIYFTRAQLYSLAGQLHEKYRFQAAEPWSSEERLRALATGDLQTADSLGLPRRFFDPTRANELGLSWLAQSATARLVLSDLATPGPPRIGDEH